MNHSSVEVLMDQHGVMMEPLHQDPLMPPRPASAYMLPEQASTSPVPVQLHSGGTPMTVSGPGGYHPYNQSGTSTPRDS
eukprot:gene2373-2041_t